MTLVCGALLAIMVAVAVYTDVRVGKIHNWVTVPFAGVGLILNGIGAGLDGVVRSLLGIAVGMGVFLFSALFGRILGGGDIKLLMAVGAIQGPVFLLWTLVYMAIIGGALAILVSLWRRDLLASLKRLVSGLMMRVFAKVPVDVADAGSTARLPYAIPIALGSMVALYVLKLQ